ncbi:MAG: hypothetical protein M3534_00465 [Actinomycetota bacterium]|nr:hypothetical protein [Actinomycetota bacterium]
MSLTVSANSVRAGLLSVVLVASLFLAGGPYAGPAYACSCSEIPDVAEGFRDSDAIFTGEMVRGGLEDPAPEDGTMVGGIEFRVGESWKGVSGESAVVYGQDTVYYGELEEGKMYTGNSCAYPFEKGGRYLVYASRYEDGFRVEGCDRTTSLASADEDLRALGPPADRLAETGGPAPLSVGGILLTAGMLLIFTVCVVGLLLKRARL